MTKTLALRAACTAAVTLSFPSRKSPLPSDTMSSSWAVSVWGGGGRGREGDKEGRESGTRAKEGVREEAVSLHLHHNGPGCLLTGSSPLGRRGRAVRALIPALHCDPQRGSIEDMLASPGEL